MTQEAMQKITFQSEKRTVYDLVDALRQQMIEGSWYSVRWTRNQQSRPQNSREQ